MILQKNILAKYIMNKNTINKNVKVVSALIKKLNRKEKIKVDNVRKAVTIVLKKEVSCRDIFLGSLFSSLMYINDPLVLKGAIQGALDLDKIMFKKIDLGKKIYAIGGSGKDDVKTFNISSIASIVVAAMGVSIFKVGAPGTSNKLGSQDLLDYLGVFKIDKIEHIKKHIDKNFLYMSVDNIVPNLFSSYDGTFFYPNVLSYGLLPLITPIRISGMIYGLSNPNIEISAKILKIFGMRNVLVVAGMDSSGEKFFDEISVIGKTKIAYIDKCGNIKEKIFNPKTVGLFYKNYKNILELKDQKTAKIRAVNILKGNATSIEMDSVAINVGGLLFLSDRTTSIEKGYFMAIDFLKSGKAFNYFKKLII